MADTSKDGIIALLMKELYSKGGYLPLIEFARLLNYVPMNASEWVSQNPKYFKIVNEENGNVFVLGLTSVTFCKNHASKADSCLTCDGLHVCKFFALGDSCKFGAQCNFSHNFETDHNRSVLEKHHLQHLDELELKCLFQKLENRCDVTRPTICKYFNNGCCQKKGCTFLHICKHYLMNNCTFGKYCKISHNLNERNMNILKMFGIKFDSISKALAQLKSLYNCEIDKLASERTMKKTNTICLHNLSLECSFKDTCRYYHKEMPYQWQFQLSTTNDNEWQDFDATWNEKIEERYCSLENETHIIDAQAGFVRYNFEMMEFSSSKNEGKLCRLSTASSVLYPNNKWNTVWVWYWKNDNECWIKYDDNNSEYPLSSDEIEKKYVCDRQQQIDFVHQGKSYFINFKEMFQMNGKKRALIRRPVFFKEKNAIKPKSDQIKREVNKNPRNKYKGNVQENNKSELRTHFQIIELENTDSDFEETATKFNETMKARGAKIMSIETIKNEELLEEYQRRKNKMATKLGSFNVNEMDLFHGTHSTNILTISQQGFDVRLSGEVCGTRFGNGCYFTKKADYAHKYITPEINLHKMFLVKVLVGHSCKGKMTYVRPPLVDPSNEGGDLYNSCVDDVENPNVFVIFANDQMYPAYIITYEMIF